MRRGDSDKATHCHLFFFTLVVECLAGLVQKAAENGRLEGYKVNSELEINLLQFADDTVIMGKGCWYNLWSIKAIFKGFKLLSGFKVNFYKSKIYRVNVDETFMETASHFFCCCRGNLPFKFLGIPVGLNPRRCASWNQVLDNQTKNLPTWKARLLSIRGRVTLLNSILSSIPIYIMSFFIAPIKIIKEIIKI